jgi:LacI family transcriptional regulator
MPKPRRVAIELELEWPYKRHAALFAGTQQYAREHGWDSIIDDFVAENLPRRRTKAVLYDGVIARATEKLATRTAGLGIPLVNVWFNSPVRDQLPGVFSDYAASGRLRAEHLLARGLRRFAVVVREDRGRKLEAAAFRAAVEEAGFACVTAKIPLHSARTHAVWLKTQQRIDARMGEWQLPIGVSVNDEASGRTIVQMCAQRGWRVPQDVAIIAGSNEEVLCENPRPSLSSTELGYQRIGYEAARLLDKLMDDTERVRTEKKGTKPQHILLPPRGIVIRESTDFYAVDDETIAAALLFIAEKSHKSIGPSDVARAVNLEPRTLRRRFAQVLGRTVVSEICRVRVERAKRELVQSDRSLAAIARDVGFETRRQMCEVFCRELGVTPREYRKRRQVNAEL